jgi:hypothetical protein
MSINEDAAVTTLRDALTADPELGFGVAVLNKDLRALAVLAADELRMLRDERDRYRSALEQLRNPKDARFAWGRAICGPPPGPDRHREIEAMAFDVVLMMAMQDDKTFARMVGELRELIDRMERQKARNEGS